jgi:predicted XRE-type DNA-binding protein
MPPRKKTKAKARKRTGSEVLSKSYLADEIKKAILERGLTQTAAAEVAKEAQSQMSLVMSGHLQGFSANRLVRILLRLGRNVEITITRTSSPRRAGKVTMHGTGPATRSKARRR